MDLNTANNLPEGAPVWRCGYGAGVWRGVDDSNSTTCWVQFADDEQPLRVPLDKTEVR